MLQAFLAKDSRVGGVVVKNTGSTLGYSCIAGSSPLHKSKPSMVFNWSDGPATQSEWRGAALVDGSVTHALAAFNDGS